MLITMLLGSCGNQSNLLKNADFEKWKDSAPIDWKMEGEGSVKRSEGNGAELTTVNAGTPFLFQSIEVKRRYKGTQVTLAAWVKTNITGNTVVEFSDRAGHDSKSEPHPGDGQWHLLQTTVRVPETAEHVEFRVRNYKQGSSLIRETSMSSGTEPLIAKSLGGQKNGNDIIKGLSALIMFMLLGFILNIFRNRRERLWMRSLEAVLLMAVLSNLMLVLGRPVNAEVTAGIVWGGAALLLGSYILSNLLKLAKAESILNLLKMPFVPFGALFIITIFLLISSLKSGSILSAEKAARGAYVLMISVGIFSVLRSFFRGFSSKQEVIRYEDSAIHQEMLQVDKDFSVE